ncbi:hypothetical protein I8751_00425 [Nostocaceae cyanobacterium CENA357]|uniref:Uncharacterized protein n=1 Tax=Atlanticothrix silvestris CENA357 TaxID=1725252 RepID=A0A8J7HE34_9CYAN|nr:hypothetical protein [Atlanticothrix silvestris]MBH8550881.1 hypothetical protein [Atlanticothrix silvestris CENA357]
MKHTNSPGEHPVYSHLFLLASLTFSGAMLLLAGRAVANNAVLRSMFSCQAQGLGGALPTINVWYQQGTNLSFLPSGETIKKVWLNDPSQVTMDFDGPMCMQFGQERNMNSGDCKNSAANVIQLRRIQKINIPGLPDIDNTLLTVITEGQGKTKLYTFKIMYEESNPDYHTLAIYADPPSASATPCVRTSK